MATDKATAKGSETNIQGMSSEQLDGDKKSGKLQTHFGKAIAHRALYASSGRQSRSRSSWTSDANAASPSRLSKVSLADEAEKESK
ncbi:GATA-type domain-containing protein [Psidium guajava]|nr:GATA-type domain-containing protein [Psidium guajava]